MSFSSQLKKQIASIGIQSDMCDTAEAYGLLVFSRLPEGVNQPLRTEQKCVAQRAAELLSGCCGVYVEVTEPCRAQKGSRFYYVTLPESERDAVMLRFSIPGTAPVEHIDRSFLNAPYCREAFLRGAFLAAGRASSPDKGYQLEFAARCEAVCNQLNSILAESGVNSKVVYRRGSWYVYIKERESIECLLASIGAGNAYYEFVNLTIYRDMRNAVNRRTNCEGANLSKTVNAAAEQVAAIQRIYSENGPESLPPELEELARLRLENPEWTLRQLGEALSQPLSRSGVNHRMRKLLELGGADDGKPSSRKELNN